MSAPNNQQSQRILSIDILRGAVMIIMALDHVRDYFHLHAFDDTATNLATTTPALFFTRWITHFCAPVFVFLSGTSAFLAGQKKPVSEQSNFLIKRGIWLVFAEISIVTLAWTFNPLFNLFILQVIWAIGWSMIILGLLAKTSRTTIIIIGCILFFGHNLLDYANLPKDGAASVIWNVLFRTNFIFYHLNDTHLVADIYAVLPWTGVMLLGYGFGVFFKSSVAPAQRKKAVLITGLALTALFILLRLINAYGDPAPWSTQKDGMYTFLSFLNTTKYPCSLQYLCMTIGPALIVLALLEYTNNTIAKILIMYGRVPFFYYVLHLFLIHAIAVIFFFATGHGSDEIVDTRTPFLFRPYHYGFDLWVVYAVWIFVVIILYWPCKWFNKYRSTHKQWWLSYV
jgi:uncharacterized membrane protein